MTQIKNPSQTINQSWKKAFNSRLGLGEGLHWDALREHLWFVDIHGCRIFCWSMANDTIETWSVPQRVGWVLTDPQSDDVLLGLQEGIAKAHPQKTHPTISAEDLTWIARPFGRNHEMRLNDAKRDNSGRIWFGSLNNEDESKSDGSLYRLNTDFSLREIETGYTVANGPAISADGTLLLHTDSGRRTIFKFKINPTTGELSDRRIWKIFKEEDGYPDGMCFDAQDCLWVAHWGASCVSRFAMDGSLLHRINLPTKYISNVCFAGTNRNRIFVTSASLSLTEEGDEFAGNLFEIFDTQGATGIV